MPKTLLFGAALLTAALSLCGWMQGYGQEKEEQEIRQVVERFVTNWGRGDFKALMQHLYSLPEALGFPPPKRKDLPMLEDFPMLVVGGDAVEVGMVIPKTAAAQPQNPFATMTDEEILRIADVPADHWAAQAVVRMYRLGIMHGYPESPKRAPKAKAAKPKPKAKPGKKAVPKGKPKAKR